MNTCFCVVEFQASVSLLNSPLSVMLFRHFVGCIYRSLREACTTSQCAVLLVSRCFAICSNERKLQHSTQLMTMTYGPKLYNPSSCVAPRRKPTMACGRITNFPSCVAWRPLCHLIMDYDRKCVKVTANLSGCLPGDLS